MANTAILIYKTIYKGKEIFHFFYAADNLDTEQWNLTNTQRKRRHKSYGSSWLKVPLPTLQP